MQSARLLRWARLHTGQSQAQLSEKTGIAQSTISRIEAGQFDPHFSVIRRLLRACGYDLELKPALGYGVDRSEIRQSLRMTPAERIAASAKLQTQLSRWRPVAARKRTAAESRRLYAD
jgi:transcriptional regulator with XRE-family HTH domain